MSVTLTINGSSYVFPSTNSDRDWAELVTEAIQALASPNNTLYKGVLTTKGDIFVRTANDIIRLPIGTDGQVLTADSTEASGMKWA